MQWNSVYRTQAEQPSIHALLLTIYVGELLSLIYTVLRNDERVKKMKRLMILLIDHSLYFIMTSDLQEKISLSWCDGKFN